MRAFIEQLCSHTGIVRVGPHAEKFGDPYDGAVVYLIDGETAHIKGLTSGGISFAHYKALSAILGLRGLKPKWQRIRRRTTMDTTFKITLTMVLEGEQSKTVYRRTVDEEPNLDPSEVMAYTAKVLPALGGALMELGPVMMGVAK